MALSPYGGGGGGADPFGFFDRPLGLLGSYFDRPLGLGRSLIDTMMPNFQQLTRDVAPMVRA